MLAVAGKKSLTWKKSGWAQELDDCNVAGGQRASQNGTGGLAGGELPLGFVFRKLCLLSPKQLGKVGGAVTGFDKGSDLGGL